MQNYIETTFLGASFSIQYWPFLVDSFFCKCGANLGVEQLDEGLIQVKGISWEPATGLERYQCH